MAHTTLNTAARTVLLATLALVLTACDKPPQIDAGKARVTLDGRVFTLDIAADEATRTKGLGGRESIADDGGMLFVFPRAQLRRFIMRDCLVDIDIVFLDAAGRVIATHHMPVEEPRKDDETLRQYELRLPQYSSKFNSKYVIEVKGGTLEQLSLDEGDQIDLDTEALDALAQ